jgi:hypothetical protein
MILARVIISNLDSRAFIQSDFVFAGIVFRKKWLMPFSNKENKNLPPVKTKFNHRIELMLKKRNGVCGVICGRG